MRRRFHARFRFRFLLSFGEAYEVTLVQIFANLTGVTQDEEVVMHDFVVVLTGFEAHTAGHRLAT